MVFAYYDVTTELAAETALPALPPDHATARRSDGAGMHILLSLAADAVQCRQAGADYFRHVVLSEGSSVSGFAMTCFRYAGDGLQFNVAIP